MQIITRKEASAAGLDRYFTGIACKRGHIAYRYTMNGVCSECNRQSVKAGRQAVRDGRIARLEGRLA